MGFGVDAGCAWELDVHCPTRFVSSADAGAFPVSQHWGKGYAAGSEW